MLMPDRIFLAHSREAWRRLGEADGSTRLATGREGMIKCALPKD
jgi:hypothetical protein